MTSPTSTDAVALLRELEWSGGGTCGIRGFCLLCNSPRPTGHTPDCRLAKAIAEQPAEAVGEDDPLPELKEGSPILRALRAYRQAAYEDGTRDEPISSQMTLDAFCDALDEIEKALRTRIEAEDRAKSGEEQRTPDHVYDKDDWEWTLNWDDRDTLTNGLDVGEIIHVGTLYKGPDKWAARIDDVEVRWFDTREAAEVALAPTPSSEKSK